MPKAPSFLARVATFIKSLSKRPNYANFFMVSFILFTSIGAAMIFLPAGLIVAGITCGIFGFLLGLE
jgi:hypothetical protein